MNCRSFGLALAIYAIGSVLSFSISHGEIIAEDSASDSAYASDTNGAWLGTNPTSGENPPGNDNGGHGFQPWNFSGGYHIPARSPYGELNHFIDGVDFAASEFNDLGSPAFALTNAQSQQGVTVRALRAFTVPMGVGDVLSFRFDSPAVLDPYASFGSPFLNMLFRGANGSTTFDIGSGVFGTGASQQVFPWRVMDGSGGFSTTISPFDTSDGSELSLEILTESTGSLTFDGQTFDIAFSNGPPASVLFQLFQNTSGDGVDPPNGNTTGEREFFFNDIMIESPDVLLSGDFDADNMIDGNDFLVWQQDPTVGNLADWQLNYGNEAMLSASSTAIPEPSTLVLLGFIVIAAIGQHHRATRNGSAKCRLRYGG